MIRQARLLTGMTQQRLAGAAGLAQSDVSAYETGRRQPTLPMLYRLLGAAGLEPRIRLEPIDAHDLTVEQWLQSLPPAQEERWRREQAALLR